MRSRDIKPGFYRNDQLAECTFAARLLFPGLWMLADREGRLEYRPKKIKVEIFPYDDVDIESLLNELQKNKLIEFYEVEGNIYILIPTFKKHQNPHVREKESTIPAPVKTVQESGNISEKPEESVQAPDKHSTSTVQEQCENNTETVPALLTPSSLTPSSLTPDLKNSLSPESINLKPRVYTREEQQGERDFSFSENPVPGELPEQEQPVTGETLPEDFVRLRKFYSENCHLEDEKAGLKDFMRLQSLGKWPGIDAVLSDLQRIMATGEYHKGFWPSLWQYLASLAGFLLPSRPTASPEQNVQPASQEPETPETPLPDRISYQGDEGNGQAVLLSAAIDSTFNGIADRQGYSFPQNQHSSQNKPTPKARDKPEPRPASLDEPIAEFQELRDFYSQNCRAEAPLAGFQEYKALKASHKWPGANRIFDDWDKRLKANHYDKGFWPGLAKYLKQETWEGPIIPRKPENNGALPERPF